MSTAVMTGWEPWVASVGLALVTLVTRAFFMIPEREVPMPEWFKRGLGHAPLAALAAVIAPELVMQQAPHHQPGRCPPAGRAVRHRLLLVAARGILGTIVIGMAVYLPLHIGWGW